MGGKGDVWKDEVEMIKFNYTYLWISQRIKRNHCYNAIYSLKLPNIKLVNLGNGGHFELPFSKMHGKVSDFNFENNEGPT